MSLNKEKLHSMSADELWALHEEISRILSPRILEKKEELEKRLAVLQGISQLNPGMKSDAVKSLPRKYPKVLPQYRNPETSETWSGRGKQPRWLTQAKALGRDIEEFKIRDQ